MSDLFQNMSDIFFTAQKKAEHNLDSVYSKTTPDTRTALR